MQRIELLASMFHRRWTVPALSSLWSERGSKFVALVKTLGASPGGMRATVDDLIDDGLVMRNPGYGHPMRPEYVLTGRGTIIGSRCASLMDALKDSGLRNIVKSKWAVPVLYVLSSKERRFSELASSLPHVTDRALAICLKQLCAAKIVQRRIEDTYPPSVIYSMAPKGNKVRAEIAALVSVLK
ncbi:MAG TPA: helix-turn-helix domain-containing protein [Fimbriimonadaceae bacterium]|nr:helix-turn-helix domain-containing protein [Fimbriimonadaceae bacterium]